MKNALRPNGIVCCQGENFWLFGETISNIIKFAVNVFPSVSWAHTQIPSYPTGTIGFIICSLEENKVFEKPVTVHTDKQIDEMELKYYNSAIHAASFVLPTSFKRVILVSQFKLKIYL
jgi:spermidine synthase